MSKTQPVFVNFYFFKMPNARHITKQLTPAREENSLILGMMLNRVLHHLQYHWCQDCRSCSVFLS